MLLKNISPTSIILQIFKIENPLVNFVSVEPILNLLPYETIDENTILVSNTNDPSYNKDIIDYYIANKILIRIPYPKLNIIGHGYVNMFETTNSSNGIVVAIGSSNNQVDIESDSSGTFFLPT